MIRLFPSICFLFFLASGYGQEKLSPLEFNPQLYYKHKASQNAQKSSILANYLFIPDTLTLPFIDDFGTNRMTKNLGTILDTINRSVELGDEIRKFYTTDTAYSFQWVSQDSVIRTALPPVDSIILNNDCGDVFLSTDTFYTWGDYFTYTYDSLGVQTDTQKVSVDSVALNYSIFQVVKDTGSTSLWTDELVFINNTYPLNQISYGVATFDGLDGFGLPYNLNGTSASRPTDTLTSKPIDLSGFSAFSNVYLSFFYEPQGLGDYPNEGDSLMLEFKISCENWRTVWAVDGFEDPIDTPVFKIVLVHLDDNFYFNNAFQFRFRSKGSQTGNNDHWHVDYVYMGATRSAIDTVMKDATVLGPPDNFLKNYQSMPWDHFKDNQAAESKTLIEPRYRNNYSVPTNINFGYMAREEITQDSLTLKELTAGNAPPFLSFDTTFVTSDFIPLNFSQDSVQISLLSYIDSIPNDLVRLNDTASVDINLFNYFAYDDGSAEISYGVENTSGLKKFACEFNLNHPDTLRAIQIHFASINYHLTFQEITLLVWSNIDFVNNTDDTLALKKISGYTFYEDEINGFATFRLDTPVVVPTKFYIGWAQLLADNVDMGLDLNNNATEHMFVYLDGEWFLSSLDNGAPMIRPVVGKDVTIIGTGIGEVPVTLNEEITFYPNPVSKSLFINVPSSGEHHVNIFDLTGKLVYSNPLAGNSVEVEKLNDGLYLFQLYNLNERKARSFRFIKLENR